MKLLCNHITVFALLVSLAGFSTAVAARSQFTDVTAIVVAPASGGINARVEEPEAVKLLMHEINAERQKLWKPFRGKLSTCAVQLTFYQNDHRLARLILDRSSLIEMEPASTSFGSVRELYSSDLGAVRRLASKVKSQSSCK
jgi:hypothetical protein